MPSTIDMRRDGSARGNARDKHAAKMGRLYTGHRIENHLSRARQCLKGGIPLREVRALKLFTVLGMTDPDIRHLGMRGARRFFSLAVRVPKVRLAVELEEQRH